MLALIDADVVRYRAGYASQDVSEAIACARANETVERVLEATGATEYELWLSDSLENNYRFQFFKDYKKSRETQPKPVHHWAIGQFLKQEWDAKVSTGQEADDALGIGQTKDTIICSIDKDLLQIPGRHFNFVRNEFYEVSYLDGLKSFYRQILTGDRTDDIPGIRGIGDVKSRKLINNLETEQEMFETVRGMWEDDDKLLLVGKLLWVRREPEDMWTFPITQQDEEAEWYFSQQQQRETDQS